MIVGANGPYTDQPWPEETWTLLRALKPQQVRVCSFIHAPTLRRLASEHPGIVLHIRPRTGLNNQGAWPDDPLNYRSWDTEQTLRACISLALDLGFDVRVEAGNEPDIELAREPVDAPQHISEAIDAYSRYFHTLVGQVRGGFGTRVTVAVAALSQGSPDRFAAWKAGLNERGCYLLADYISEHLYSDGRPLDDPDWLGRWRVWADIPLPVDVTEINDNGKLFTADPHERAQHYKEMVQALDGNVRTASLFTVPGAPDDTAHPMWWYLTPEIADAVANLAQETPMPDLRAYARQTAQRAGINEDYFVNQIQQESGFDPNAHNPSGADGIAQIVVSAHPAMAGKTRDPIASLDYAADLVALYLRRFGDYPHALAAYNWGSGNVGGGYWDGVQHEPWDGRRASLPAETQHYLDVILGPDWENQMPDTATFNPDYPAVLQDDGASCAPTSLTWALRALGRTPGDNWIENDMARLGYWEPSPGRGLLDHTGRGIVSWLSINDPQHYGSDGYGASNNQCPITWDELVPEIDPNPPYPLLLGLPNWDLAGGGHWVGVRGFRDGKIQLANPATGATYGQTELTRQQFEARAAGNASIVRVLSTEAAVPAPDPQPAPPSRIHVLLDEIQARVEELRRIA